MKVIALFHEWTIRIHTVCDAMPIVRACLASIPVRMLSPAPWAPEEQLSAAMLDKDNWSQVCI